MIRPFDLAEDLPVLQYWMRQRETYEPKADEMPALGWIIYAEGSPVATAFLRKVEGGFAQLDGLATNPHYPADGRDKALDELVTHVMSEAKRLKFKAVTATSRDKHTLLRSQRHGFTSTSHVYIVADLSKGT